MPDPNSSNWSYPANELTNYTRSDNISIEGLDGTHHFDVLWDTPELMAWKCNQSDNCWGFTHIKNSSNGGFYIIRDSNDTDYLTTTKAQNNNLRETYRKKGNNWRKARDPDTSDPSILSQSRTNVRLYVDGFPSEGTGVSCYSGATGREYDLTKPGTISYDSGTYNNAVSNPYWGNGGTNEGFADNSISGYFIPLGWKYTFAANAYYMQGEFQDYGYQGTLGRRLIGNDAGGCLHMSSTLGMNDKLSTGILQNIGFDIKAHWIDMEDKGVDSDDAKRIRVNYCNNVSTVNDLYQIKAGMSSDGSDCLGAYNALYGANAQNIFDAKLLSVCSSGGNWQGDPICQSKISNIIQNNVNNANASTALGLLQKFCRGGDGSDPKGIGPGRSQTGTGNLLCACLNAHDFGLGGTNEVSCYTYPNMYGCAEVVSKTQDVINYSTPQGITQFKNSVGDPGQLTGYCQTARQACGASSSACVIPYQPNAQNITLITQICSFVNEAEILVNSPITNKCTPSVTVVNGSSTSSVSSSPSSSSSSSSSSSDGTTDSKSKIPFIVGGCIIFLLIFATLIALALFAL